MKKVLVSMLVLAVTTGVAFAGNGDGIGAVKTGLYARQEGDDPNAAGSGPWVGFAILNTTCEGMLNVNVVVKDLPEGMYDVYVKVNGAADLVGQVNTNTQGKGASQFELYEDIGVGNAVEKGDSIPVQVVVKETGLTTIVGAATATVDVPLKFECEEPEEPEE